MKLNLDIRIELDCSKEDEISLKWIDKVLESAAKMENLPPVEISVLIVDNETIQQLNKQYRRIDRPTDVLSFPLFDPGELKNLSGDNLQTIPLGDIVISLPKAKEQAKELGHSLDREIGFLTAHSFLHLLGFDHDNDSSEQAMIEKQEEILSKIGLLR